MERERSLRQRIEWLNLSDDDWYYVQAWANKGMTLEEIGGDYHGGVTRARVQQVIGDRIARTEKYISRLEPVLDDLEASTAITLISVDDEVTVKEAARIMHVVLDAARWEETAPKHTERLITAVRGLVRSGRLGKLGRWPGTVLALASLEPPLRKHPMVAEMVIQHQKAQAPPKVPYVELARTVLEEAGEPLHWKEIARRAESLNLRKKFYERVLHSHIMADKEMFVRVGRGTYGLTAWGLETAQSYPDIIADVLDRRRRPLDFETICAAVEQVRTVRRLTLQTLLDWHPRFYRSADGTYGLRCWLAPRTQQTAETSLAYVEPPNSYLRVERALIKGYDVAQIVLDDRLRMRGDG